MAAPGRKLVTTKSGLRMVTDNGENPSPFALDEPVWIPDNECAQCMQCQGRFAMMKRRHHCRRCGKCLCSNCCETKLLLTRMSFVDPVRHCADCVPITKKEVEFFDKPMKLLNNGASFFVGPANDTSNLGPQYICKVSNDTRYLQFDGNEALDRIDMCLIEGIQIQTAGTDNMGNVVASGVLLKYKDSCGEMQNTRLTLIDDTNRKQGTMWIAAMQRAMKLMYASRGIATSPTTPTTIIAMQ